MTFKEIQGISPKMLAVLEKHGFINPTPIQAKVIPIGVEGKDIIGIAQTGTGKTLGFGVPMIERILSDKALKKDSRGIVILPTRELALQVDETLRKIGATPGMNLGIYTAVLIGGDSMTRQIRDLRNGPDIVIATPGRLIDHLKRGTISLDRVNIAVLDEADHMFDIGFAPQIREILKKIPKDRQTMLFSATMPDEIAKLAMENMKLPLRIEVAPQGTSAQNVEQEIIVVERKSKFNLLVKMIGEHAGQPIIVFTRTKHGAKDIATDLNKIGTRAVEIHSNRTLAQRRAALDGFKKHTYQVLVATDIAARGIDVKDIGLVVNYDLPEQSEDYVHRIGRTGRAGKSGKAVSFATPDQKFDITKIERLIKKELPKKSHEGAVMSDRGGSGGFGGSRGGYRGHRGFGGGFRGRGGFGGSSASRGGGSFAGGARSFGSASRSGGSFGRSPQGRPFRAHTNQAFKGGAPRSAGSTSRGAGNFAPRSTSGFGARGAGTSSSGPRRVFRKGVR